MADYGLGSKVDHDYASVNPPPRYLFMFAERETTPDGAPAIQDPIFGFRGATTISGTDAKFVAGILSGSLPTPEHDIALSNLSAGLIGETDRVSVKPVLIFDPHAGSGTGTGITAAVDGSVYFDSDTGELMLYSGTWSAITTGSGMTAHALNGAYHTGDLDYTQLDAIVDTSGVGTASMISAATHVHTDADGSSRITYANLASIPSSFTPDAHVLATTGPHTGELPLADLAAGTQGSIIKRGVTDWEELSKGTETYVLTAGATDVSWQPASGGIGGSGTIGSIPKFVTDTTTLTDSLISESGTVLTIESSAESSLNLKILSTAVGTQNAGLTIDATEDAHIDFSEATVFKANIYWDKGNARLAFNSTGALAYFGTGGIETTGDITLTGTLNLKGTVNQMYWYDRDGDADSWVFSYLDKADTTGLRMAAYIDGAYVDKPLHLYTGSVYKPALYDAFPDDVTLGADLIVLGHDIFGAAPGTTNQYLNILGGGAPADGSYITLYGHTHSNDGNIHAVLNSASGTPFFRLYDYDGVSTWNSVFEINNAGFITTYGDASSFTDNDVIAWDTATSKFIAQAQTGGGGGPGTGTLNYIPYWNTTTTLGDSLMSQSSSRVTVNGPQLMVGDNGAESCYIGFNSSNCDAYIGTAYAVNNIVTGSIAGDLVISGRGAGGILLSADVNYAQKHLYINETGTITTSSSLNVGTSFACASNNFDIDASGNIIDCGSIAMSGALTGVTSIAAGSGGFDVDTSGNLTDCGTIRCSSLSVDAVGANPTVSGMYNIGRYGSIQFALYEPTSGALGGAELIFWTHATAGGGGWVMQPTANPRLVLYSSFMPYTSNAYDLGSTSYYWGSVFSNYIRYKTTPSSFDHIDDLAIIDSMIPTEAGTINTADLPKEIFDDDGFFNVSNFQGFLTGSIKQLHTKVKEQASVIEYLIEENTALGVRITALEAP